MFDALIDLRNRLGYITDGVALMLGAQLTEDKHNREAQHHDHHTEAQKREQ